MLRQLLCWLVVAGLCASPACHTMRFEVSGEPHTSVVTEHKSFFFWGLAPTMEVDVKEKCPAGVVAVEEEESFSDGFLSLLTLGLWAPRSSKYYCR